MELIQSHHAPGPGPIHIEAPELPVEITVRSDVEYRQVHVMVDRGLGAHARSGGAGGRELHVVVGRPGMVAWIASLFGRQSSATSGGSVKAGRKSVVAGGSIDSNAIGKGARVTIDGQPVQRKGPGVHLTVPPGCTFDVRAHDGIRVHYNMTEMTIETAVEIGILERA
jgi:hypothetical protein